MLSVLRVKARGARRTRRISLSALLVAAEVNDLCLRALAEKPAVGQHSGRHGQQAEERLSRPEGHGVA